MKPEHFINLISLVLVIELGLLIDAQIDVQQLQCLVCQIVVEEMEKEIENVSPNKKIDIGHYRLDDRGESKKIEYRRSEIFLTELMETVCNKMDDYVRATYKSNGQLVVIPVVKDGHMNPVMQEVDIIQDGDLNKSLKFYCEHILEEYEDAAIKLFRSGADNIDIRLCSESARLCNQSIDEEYNFEEDKDEL